jgi:hypothetical protein
VPYFANHHHFKSTFQRLAVPLSEHKLKATSDFTVLSMSTVTVKPFDDALVFDSLKNLEHEGQQEILKNYEYAAGLAPFRTRYSNEKMNADKSAVSLSPADPSNAPSVRTRPQFLLLPYVGAQLEAEATMRALESPSGLRKRI